MVILVPDVHGRVPSRGFRKCASLDVLGLWGSVMAAVRRGVCSPRRTLRGVFCPRRLRWHEKSGRDGNFNSGWQEERLTLRIFLSVSVDSGTQVSPPRGLSNIALDTLDSPAREEVCAPFGPTSTSYFGQHKHIYRGVSECVSQTCWWAQNEVQAVENSNNRLCGVRMKRLD